MIKGVFIAFGIMMVLALLPVPLLAIPFGPFIGGYFGIASASSHPGSHLARAVKFGSLLGLLILLLSAAVAAILTVMFDLNLALLWLSVGVFTLYSANMAALGAIYAELRAAR